MKRKITVKFFSVGQHSTVSNILVWPWSIDVLFWYFCCRFVSDGHTVLIDAGWVWQRRDPVTGMLAASVCRTRTKRQQRRFLRSSWIRRLLPQLHSTSPTTALTRPPCNLQIKQHQPTPLASLWNLRNFRWVREWITLTLGRFLRRARVQHKGSNALSLWSQWWMKEGRGQWVTFLDGITALIFLL